MLLSEALKQYIEWASCFKAPRTVQVYEQLIGRFIKHVGDKDIKDIDIRVISQYIAHLQKKYAESTVMNMIVSVRVLFKFLYERGVLVWDYRLIPIPKYTQKSFPSVEKKEALKMIDRVHIKDFQTLRNKTIISFLYATGCRVSELCDLRVGELKDQYAVIRTKKSRKLGRIFWDKQTDFLLRIYLEERKRVANTDHVFVSVARNIRGGKLSTRSIERIVESYRRGTRVVPHSFRHALAEDLVKKNVGLRHIQEILRHESLRSLETYTRLHDQELKKVYDKHRG